MLTIFTSPKPFIGKFNIIQRNAIQSWTLLNPKPEIILLDKVEGTETVAKDLGIQNSPDISQFKKAQSSAKNDLVGYVNADIILTDSIFTAIETVKKFVNNSKFLVVGKRWSIFLDRPFNFKKGDWQDDLKKFREYNDNGFMGHAGQIDYFIFPKNIEWNTPPFLMGKGAWNGWFIHNAIKMEIPVIDASGFITAYHQEHFNFDPADYNKKQTKKERRINKKLSGGFLNRYTILDSSHRLTFNGLKKSSFIRRFSSNFSKIKMLFVD
ncbi:MAG: hypothetical protein ABII25_04000 [bacterium]